MVREAAAAASAGINPLGYIARETLQVLAEVGVATTGLRSKGLKDVDLKDCRLLVNLSTYSLGTRIPASFKDRLLQRPVVDPYGRGLEVYREARDAITGLVTGEIIPWLLSS